jgi:hypothetical protein
MSLTFRSTGTSEVIIIQQDSDGTRRIARAIQDSANPRQWKTQLEHPSGVRPCSNVYGTRNEAALALTHHLHETEVSYRQEKARGHRPEAMLPDRNVPIDPFGNSVRATIMPRR